MPNTQYTLNLTGTLATTDQSNTKIYSQPANIEFSTDFDAPPYVDRPEQDRRPINNPQQVYLRLHRASKKNGPIDRYYVVVHLLDYPFDSTYLPQNVKTSVFLSSFSSKIICSFDFRVDENVVIQLLFSMNPIYPICFC